MFFSEILTRYSNLWLSSNVCLQERVGEHRLANMRLQPGIYCGFSNQNRASDVVGIIEDKVNEVTEGFGIKLGYGSLEFRVPGWLSWWGSCLQLRP